MELDEPRLRLFELKELVGEFVPDKYYTTSHARGVLFGAKVGT